MTVLDKYSFWPNIRFGQIFSQIIVQKGFRLITNEPTYTFCVTGTTTIYSIYIYIFSWIVFQIHIILKIGSDSAFRSTCIFWIADPIQSDLPTHLAFKGPKMFFLLAW
jgi:hypothetical protein